MESRENREQSRCCNWKQHPPSELSGEEVNRRVSGGEDGMKENPPKAEAPRSQNTSLPGTHSFRARSAAAGTPNLLRRIPKKNEDRMDLSETPDKASGPSKPENLLSMKKMLFILLAAAGIALTSAQSQTLTGTVGTGPDASYLVIEAQDFGAPLVYEYRYNFDPLSPLSGADMMLAVDAAFSDISFAFGSGGGFLESITYQSITLVNTDTPPFSPFWAYWVSGGESGIPLAPMPEGVWSEGVGILNRTLAPDSWDGFIFNGEFASEFPYNMISPPPSVAPIPEPNVVLLFASGVVGALIVRRKRDARF